MSPTSDDYRPRPHDREIEPMFGALDPDTGSGDELSKPAAERKPRRLGCLVLLLACAAAAIVAV